MPRGPEKKDKQSRIGQRARSSHKAAEMSIKTWLFGRAGQTGTIRSINEAWRKLPGVLDPHDLLLWMQIQSEVLTDPNLGSPEFYYFQSAL
jgi:hypothetical protein